MNIGIIISTDPIAETYRNFVNRQLSTLVSEVRTDDSPDYMCRSRWMEIVEGISDTLTDLFIYDNASEQDKSVIDFIYSEIIRLGIPHTNVIRLHHSENYIIFELEV